MVDACVNAIEDLGDEGEETSKKVGQNVKDEKWKRKISRLAGLIEEV